MEDLENTIGCLGVAQPHSVALRRIDEIRHRQAREEWRQIDVATRRGQNDVIVGWISHSYFSLAEPDRSLTSKAGALAGGKGWPKYLHATLRSRVTRRLECRRLNEGKSIRGIRVNPVRGCKYPSHIPWGLQTAEYQFVSPKPTLMCCPRSSSGVSYVLVGNWSFMSGLAMANVSS